MSRNQLLRKEDLVNNPTARVPVCLCLDTSGSMDGDPIKELNKGIRLFYDAIKDDEIASHSVEICIVTFDSTTKCAEDFANIDRQENIPVLRAGGLTCMGEGINLALDLLEKRKQEYQDVGVTYYQPWLVLMTDGEPNGDKNEFEKARDRTVNLINDKKLTIFPIGIGKNVDMNILRMFSPKRIPLRLRGLRFKEFFEWLSKSVATASNSNGGMVELDREGITNPDSGWAEL